MASWIDDIRSGLTTLLSGQHEPGQAHEFGLANQIEQLYLSSVAEFEYLAEINRANGQSGVIASRQYTQDHASHIGYTPINGHNHWNFRRVVGQAEFSAMMNGYYLRTRHNDYHLVQAVDAGESFLGVQDIDTPPVPSDVVGGVSDQVAQVKKYFEALQGDRPQSEVADFESAFQWVLSYLECWWEVVDPDQLDDAFHSDRHEIAAKTIKELIIRDQYYAYGGHKNIRENIPHLVTAIKDVDERGRPIFRVLKYRVVAAPVGSVADHPISAIMEPVEDPLSRLRWPNEQHPVDSRLQRFQVKQARNSTYVWNWNNQTILDEFMRKVPGLDGKGSRLSEEYFDEDATDVLTEFGSAEEPLNAAYYSRFYSMTDDDASNRVNARRGFSDPMLWTAMTSQNKVFTREYDGKRYAFSFAIPLELFIDTFLDNWNPHGVVDGDARANLLRDDHYQDHLTPGGPGRTETNPLPGSFREGIYYRTPAELFEQADETQDPADTGVNARWMMCEDGVARLHYASGTPFFLPKIAGHDQQVRLRYPIYPVHHEGQSAFKELQATLRSTVQAEIQKEIEVLRADFPVAPNFIRDSKKFVELCKGRFNEPIPWLETKKNAPWDPFIWKAEGDATVTVVTLDRLDEFGIPYGGDLRKAVNLKNGSLDGEDFHVVLLDVEITEAEKPNESPRFFLLAQQCPKITGWWTGEETTQARVMANVVSQSGDIRYHVMANRAPRITLDASHVGRGWLYHTGSMKGLGGCFHPYFEGIGRMKVAVCLQYQSFGYHGKDRFLWAGSAGDYFSDDV